MPERSPIILWLLLAATTCVDAVAVVWMFDSGLDNATATLYLSLAFAQLSIVCVWAVLIHQRLWAWIVPFAAGVVAALVMAAAEHATTPGDTRDEYLAFTGLMSFHVAVILPMLWLIKPTRIGATLSELATRPRWQFSIIHLLILMTCLSILIGVFGRSEMLADEVISVVTFPIANAALLAAVLAVQRLIGHWLLRCAASLGTALFVGAACELTQTAFADELNALVGNLIQAFVLWFWLEQLQSPIRCDGVEGDDSLPVPSAAS
jgi:hypothetical protein